MSVQRLPPEAIAAPTAAASPQPARRARYRYVPNAITVSRLLLGVLFFLLLNGHEGYRWFAAAMWAAFVVWVVAGLTDILDGRLARAWHVESAFGRVVDPFVDKIMVCGAFVFFSSPAFLNPAIQASFHSFHATAITGVAPWMAVVLIAREFLVTGIRGLAESRGIDFRAGRAGKIKMFVQCFAVGAITGDLATAVHRGYVQHVPWILFLRNLSIWATVIITAMSATGYIVRAWRTLDA